MSERYSLNFKKINKLNTHKFIKYITSALIKQFDDLSQVQPVPAFPSHGVSNPACLVLYFPLLRYCIFYACISCGLRISVWHFPFSHFQGGRRGGRLFDRCVRDNTCRQRYSLPQSSLFCHVVLFYQLLCDG